MILFIKTALVFGFASFGLCAIVGLILCRRDIREVSVKARKYDELTNGKDQS
jgi:hypothetical protein